MYEVFAETVLENLYIFHTSTPKRAKFLMCPIARASLEVLLVLIRMIGQRATPERLRQHMEVVPEEATNRGIRNPEKDTFRGLHLVNAAERRIAGERTIAWESAYLMAHVKAATVRNRARQALRDAEKRWGELLSWRAVRSSRTAPDCLALDGRNFFAWAPSKGSPPGSLHPRCRCVAGPAIAGAPGWGSFPWRGEYRGPLSLGWGVPEWISSSRPNETRSGAPRKRRGNSSDVATVAPGAAG